MFYILSQLRASQHRNLFSFGRHIPHLSVTLFLNQPSINNGSFSNAIACLVILLAEEVFIFIMGNF